MGRILPADCLSCGCISGAMLSVLVSSCFHDWGRYGEYGEIGLSDCITYDISEHMSQLFMGVSGSAAMIVFRGYDRFHMLINEIDRTAIPFDIVNSGARVNCVLLNAYRDMRDKVKAYIEKHPELRIVHFVGHSMGAGIATLAAVDIAHCDITVHAHTFGSPKVGDSWFKKIYAAKVNRTNRYVMSSDPIPLYPWDDEYVHVCRPTYISPILERLPIWIGMIKNFLMMMMCMSKRGLSYKIVSKFSGLEGHRLYNYAFSIRKLSEHLNW
jgi:hypothetical protein